MVDNLQREGSLLDSQIPKTYIGIFLGILHVHILAWQHKHLSSHYIFVEWLLFSNLAF